MRMQNVSCERVHKYRLRDTDTGNKKTMIKHPYKGNDKHKTSC